MVQDILPAASEPPDGSKTLTVFDDGNIAVEIHSTPEALRKSCRHLMVDLDLDNRKRGAMPILARELSQKMGRNISVSTLAMALSGNRESESYRTLLRVLQTMLLGWLSPDSRGRMIKILVRLYTGKPKFQ